MSHQKIKLIFDSELPESMQKCIEKWRNYSVNKKTKVLTV